MKPILKYQQFSQFLLSEIQKGTYKPGAKLPSERELAKIYDLAHMTVNKALNGLVSAGYLRRIQGIGTYVAESTGLQQACVILDYKYDIHAVFPALIQRTLSSFSYIITTFDSLTIGKQPDLFRSYLSESLDLFIFDGWKRFPFELLDYIPASCRKIVINRYESAKEIDASFVFFDSEQAGYMAAQALLSQGKQDIALLGTDGDEEYIQVNLYKKGCQRALSEVGLELKRYFDHDYISKDEILSILTGENCCDGIIALYDAQLVPVIKQARESELQVPALVGKGNTPWAECYDLTSIDIQINKFEQALNTAISFNDDIKVKITPKMIYRASCPNSLHAIKEHDNIMDFSL